MLLDATVARSIAVLGWGEQLAKVVGGSLRLASGMLSHDPHEASELRGIRAALQREVATSQPGSRHHSIAASAVQGLDVFLTLGPPTVTVLIPDADEIAVALRLSSRDAENREWRGELGVTARRLDAGEAVSIAIARARALDFGSDDEQAILAYTALTGRAAMRTRDAIKLLVTHGLINDATGRDAHRFLQTDQLHLLGGPEW